MSAVAEALVATAPQPQVVPEGIQKLSVIPSCDTFHPDMVSEFGAEGAAQLCTTRREVLEGTGISCGGCACAQLIHLANNHPEDRAALGELIREVPHQGGAN